MIRKWMLFGYHQSDYTVRSRIRNTRKFSPLLFVTCARKLKPRLTLDTLSTVARLELYIQGRPKNRTNNSCM